jgi:hypothetical protein
MLSLKCLPLCIIRNKPYEYVNRNKIIEAHPCEAIFTNAQNEKSIVATNGNFSSFVVGGYDETNKIVFIVQFSNPQEIQKCGFLIWKQIFKSCPKKIIKPIQLHLRGNILNKNIFEELNAIKKWMNFYANNFPMIIISEYMSERDVTLAIDSKTGIFTSYNYRKNPNHNYNTSDIVKTLYSIICPTINIISYCQ